MEKYLLYSILGYFLIMNLIGFFSMGLDKGYAKKGKHRTPEKTLMRWALLGGSIGSLLGMKVFHHKTLHKKFTIGIPAILILQLAAIGYIIYLIYIKK